MKKAVDIELEDGRIHRQPVALDISIRELIKGLKVKDETNNRWMKVVRFRMVTEEDGIFTKSEWEDV